MIEPAERKAKTRAVRAEKKIDKAATDAAQAVLDTEKKIDKKKRKAKTKVKADKPAVEAVAEALAAPVEAVKEKKTRKHAPKTEMTFVIQSPFGGEITPEEIRTRIGEADAVYIRVDQNKAYWVKGGETGELTPENQSKEISGRSVRGRLLPLNDILDAENDSREQGADANLTLLSLAP